MARTFRISGTVVDAQTHEPVSGLRVDAWDQDAPAHAVRGSAFTDSRGRFQIAFDLSDAAFRENPNPDAYLKVFRGATPIETSRPVAMKGLAAGDTEVRVEVTVQPPEPEVKDRVSLAQVESVVDFFRLSDFAGVWHETRDRITTFAGVFGDAAKEKMKGFELKPLKASENRTKDVVGQDPGTAQKRLADRQIIVNSTKPYREAVSAQPLVLLRNYPLTLPPGTKVDLYEENGVVRAYSIVKTPPLTADPATVGRIGDQVNTLRTDVDKLNRMQADLEAVKTSSQNTSAQLSEEVAAVRTQQAVVDEIKQELAAVKAQSAQKDAEIATLRQTLDTVKTAQDQKLKELETTISRLRPTP
jgi:hypothetical protein